MDPQRAEHYNIQVVNSLIRWVDGHQQTWIAGMSGIQFLIIDNYKALYKFSRLEIHFILNEDGSIVYSNHGGRCTLGPKVE